VIARRWFTRSDKPGDGNTVKDFAELGPAELAKQRLVTAAVPAKSYNCECAGENFCDYGVTAEYFTEPRSRLPASITLVRSTLSAVNYCQI